MVASDTVVVASDTVKSAAMEDTALMVDMLESDPDSVLTERKLMEEVILIEQLSGREKKLIILTHNEYRSRTPRIWWSRTRLRSRSGTRPWSRTWTLLRICDVDTLELR